MISRAITAVPDAHPATSYMPTIAIRDIRRRMRSSDTMGDP